MGEIHPVGFGSGFNRRNVPELSVAAGGGGRENCRVFNALRQLAWACTLSIVVLMFGCTPKQYVRQADRSAYRALWRGQKAALGESVPFDIKYRPFDGAEGIRVRGKLITLGGGTPQDLTVDDCLEIAFRNSREYQNRREELYTGALALANARRSWDVPLLGGELDAEAEHTRINKQSEAKSASAELGPTLTQRLIHGGVLTLAATVDWATDFVMGSQSNIATSLLEANFTQPLLRGAWRGLAYEDQYRLERDFLFAVFDYERFRQTFAADIFTRYYSVLRQRDELENERENIERLKRTLALTRVLVEGGQRSRIQQDQAEQDLLDAQVRFERNQQDYRNALDNFKILLGLPIRANVELDYPAALRKLAEIGPKEIPFKEPEAIAIAFTARPDVLTEQARLRDAERDVTIAADQFNPQLDVKLDVSVEGTEPRRFERLRFHDHKRVAGVTFNYELDQTDNRDAYRLSIIAYERARRDLAEFMDRVRLEVRQSYRELVQSRRSYELRKRNVHIASRRRKLASLEQKQGQASARDVLEAEDALRRAQNGLTSALVSYVTTRVQFLATLGMIEVDARGKPHERKKPFKFDRIARRYPYVERR